MLSGFVACKDDDVIRFDMPVQFKQPLSFREIPGGAVMYYYLPDDMGIYGLRVRYADHWGRPVTINGSYVCDSVVLTGFTEERKAGVNPVKAQVSFFNSDMAESEPIEVEFGTLPSATVAVFENLTVNPFWGGFNVTYTSPEEVSGIIHIFYLGENKYSNQPDSILMGSFPISEGGDTLNFVLQQKMDSTTVIVRTDDYRGNRVKQIVAPKMPCLAMDVLKYKEGFDFWIPNGEDYVIEADEFNIGFDYLFDGDTKGVQFRDARLEEGERYKYHTFMAGPYIFEDKVRFCIDLKEPKVPASVRLYAYLYYGSTYPDYGDEWLIEFPEYARQLWEGSYISRLPSKLKLYGTNKDPETVKIGSEDCALLFTLDDYSGFRSGFCNSWAQRTDDLYSKGTDKDYLEATDAEVEAADPIYLNMLCNYTGTPYRYLFFVVEDTYNSSKFGGEGEERNIREYVTFHELEVYVEAE
jgi:hypothetical protein